MSKKVTGTANSGIIVVAKHLTSVGRVDVNPSVVWHTSFTTSSHICFLEVSNKWVGVVELIGVLWIVFLKIRSSL